ncbi:hypothetical protein GM921_15020 [Pedobacter sp. LMG 31464]|uniref:Uncharacterized protein n=1 Tax=Pedobacter planticolens TaxID=2679964 RepID=A0A923E1S6_9SPHI|nr:hypothetical protein [Pedobacter planticolens]MBB2146813.1 hypothetical protein [Pedobacter planticolens]
MKNFRIMISMIMFLIVIMLGCSSDKVRDFIPGTYVNSAGGEFSVASDTLEVELIKGNNYVIHRRTGFNLVTDGKLGKREYEVEKWSAVYSSNTQVLTETKKGKLISFFPDSGLLRVGQRSYKKMD